MDGSIITEAAAARPRSRWRRRLLILGAALGLLAGGPWYGHYWWTTGQYLQSTDDAYSQADAVNIAPRIAGHVTEVGVGDNQAVHVGQVLARIDDRDFRVALDQAKADLAGARADLDGIDAQIALQHATVAQMQADVESADAGLRFARAEYERYQSLARTGNGTVQRAEQAESDIRQKAAALSHARAALDAETQRFTVLKAQRARDDANVLRADAVARQAELNLGYTVITAPIAGIVGDRSLRLGQYLQPGAQIMSIVPAGHDIFLVANFKETQVAHMRRNQAADVAFDTFPGMHVHGHVDSLAPGSGAQFALLPPENATGNFTKIVQRVPVRIVLDVTDADLLAQLRPGLSAVVTVDTR